MREQYVLELADFEIPCDFIFENTADYFEGYCKKKENTSTAVKVSDYYWEKYLSLKSSETSNAFWEYSLLVPIVSDKLLEKSRCVFHGMVFIWKEKAYLFTAPSGTGKTTQYVLWKRKYGDEIQILNGDKPVLELCEDGTIMVHPSPWKGKERMCGNTKAPLAGIVLLRQGKQNQIRRMQPREAVLPILKQFFFTTEKEDTVHRVCSFEENLLQKIPVWELVNRGDEESVQLTYDTLLEYEREQE